MKKWLSIWLIVAACGGSSSHPGSVDAAGGSGDSVGTFDEELPGFKTTLCQEQAQCSGADEAMCLNDVTTDMADAKSSLDDAGEMRCAMCMHVKRVELQKILDAGCDPAAASEAAVLAACDLNPSDGQDMPDEACAGYP